MIYHDGDGVITHTGLVRGVLDEGTVMVESKWGIGAAICIGRKISPIQRCSISTTGPSPGTRSPSERNRRLPPAARLPQPHEPLN